MNDSGTNDPSTPSTRRNIDSIGSPRIGLVGICAVIVCILFFVPWISILGFSASGYDMAKQGGDGLLFALIPFGAAFAVYADVTGNQIKTVAFIAGIIPLLLFGFYYLKTGKDLLSILQPGGYGVIATSIVLALTPAASSKKS